jgi:hypothetical protein
VGRKTFTFTFFSCILFSVGYAVAHLVEALLYKPEVAGSIPHGIFH